MTKKTTFRDRLKTTKKSSGHRSTTVSDTVTDVTDTVTDTARAAPKSSKGKPKKSKKAKRRKSRAKKEDAQILVPLKSVYLLIAREHKSDLIDAVTNWMSSYKNKKEPKARRQMKRMISIKKILEGV